VAVRAFFAGSFVDVFFGDFFFVLFVVCFEVAAFAFAGFAVAGSGVAALLRAAAPAVGGLAGVVAHGWILSKTRERAAAVPPAASLTTSPTPSTPGTAGRR
jgi:hypothetical protein